MSEILIPNVDLPKKEEDATYLRIDSYGHVFQYDHRTKEMRTVAKVVELPPHGRLIDENDLVPLIEDNYGCGVCKNKADEERCLDRCKWAALLNDIDSLPTVLEASKERE